MIGSEDISLLLRATLKLYRKSFSRAFLGTISNWRMVVLHCLLFVSLALLLPLLAKFDPIAGGFALGMLLALVLAVYLHSVSAGVSLERPSLGAALREGPALFSPVLGVLFTFFIFGLIANSLFNAGELLWLRKVVGLLAAVLFNVLPEVLYLRSGGVLDSFSTSLEFIKENFLEWFIPHAVLVLVFIYGGPSGSGLLLLEGLTKNPVHLLEILFLFTSGSLEFFLAHVPLLTAAVFFCYFLMIFRGVLYSELASSSRRKRIYRERFS